MRRILSVFSTGFIAGSFIGWLLMTAFFMAAFYYSGDPHSKAFASMLGLLGWQYLLGFGVVPAFFAAIVASYFVVRFNRLGLLQALVIAGCAGVLSALFSRFNPIARELTRGIPIENSDDTLDPGPSLSLEFAAPMALLCLVVAAVVWVLFRPVFVPSEARIE